MPTNSLHQFNYLICERLSLSLLKVIANACVFLRPYHLSFFLFTNENELVFFSSWKKQFIS